MLEERRAEVLRALVEEHIRTGEPVSSRTILERTGLQVSSATIRHDLAALETEGFVLQPHTSAGRVPTTNAYRYYVDHLSPSRLRTASRARIAEFFTGVHFELGKLLKATSQLLADVTHYPSVIVGPGPEGELVKAVHLVQLGARTAMLVVVTESGRVCQEICRLPAAITPRELEQAQEELSTRVVGTELGSENPVDEQASVRSAAARSTLEVATQALHRAALSAADVYLGGTRQMATLWEDLHTVHRVLELLEREAMMLDILARAPGTLIQIGAELPVGDEVDMAVVSTSFGTGGPTAGRVGVIGPMRMDYGGVISVVESVGRELGDRMRR